MYAVISSLVFNYFLSYHIIFFIKLLYVNIVYLDCWAGAESDIAYVLYLLVIPIIKYHYKKHDHFLSLTCRCSLIWTLQLVSDWPRVRMIVH